MLVYTHTHLQHVPNVTLSCSCARRHVYSRTHVQQVPNVTLNGDKDARFPGNLNLSFAYVEGESTFPLFDSFACVTWLSHV